MVNEWGWKKGEEKTPKNAFNEIYFRQWGGERNCYYAYEVTGNVQLHSGD